MSPETDKQIANILSKALEMAERTGTFIIDQTVDVLQQLVLWRICFHSLRIVLFAGLIFAAYKMIKYLNALVIEHDEDTYIVAFIFGYIISVIVIVFSLIALWIHIEDLVQLLVAPKVYLIEYAVELSREAQKKIH